mmetsp:Transcript_76596/g.135123  ORF Transcript_76596/g.135123 Transcript_76596/m.135123 type:complete len:322 (-) Transcript_76596:7-972(-)
MPFVDALNACGTPYKLYYRLLPRDVKTDSSENRPRVLLLMGMGGVIENWKFQTEHLASFCQVCLLDNRGVGYSEAPRDEWRWTTSGMARDAGQVMDALNWQDGVHIIGISMGGMIAQELALACPSRVASLSLISTASSPLHTLPSTQALLDFARAAGVLPASAKERGLAQLRLNFPAKWLEESRKSELHGGQEVSNERWMKKMGVLMAKEVPTDLRAQGRGPPLPPPLSSMRKQLSAVLTHRTSAARFQACRSLFPVTIITGDSDELMRPVNSRVLAEILQQPEHVLEGCGHGLIQQDPSRVNALLERTIREAEQGPQAKL